MTFFALGLSAPIVEAVAGQGYETPSPIQARAIPAVIDGRDVMAAAQTGTGKTLIFVLPVLERLSKRAPVRGNQVRALVLAPIRELAVQIGESVATLWQAFAFTLHRGIWRCKNKSPDDEITRRC